MVLGSFPYSDPTFVLEIMEDFRILKFKYEIELTAEN